MKLVVYVRVSTQQQAQTQTIEQQLTLLEGYCHEHQWPWPPAAIFRDDGYSGGSLQRPGLNALRDAVLAGTATHVLVTAPDRLARKYVHQVLLIEELVHAGCQVQFVERPMSDDPHDQLLLQIRGAVAEYERSLIADRTRRGRWAKFVSGSLLPWSRPPYAYRLSPDRPGDPHGVQLEPTEAVRVAEMFAYYLEEGHTLWGLTKQLTDLAIPAPRGRTCWRKSTVRSILTNPVYTGQVYVGRRQPQLPQRRRNPLKPVGLRAQSQRLLPRERWTWVAHVPAIITQEVFDRVQTKLADNQAKARRNNTAHTYLLRALVSCGGCTLAWHARTCGAYQYYFCTGSKRRAESGLDQRCAVRSIRAEVLDCLVWDDLCKVLVQPQLIAQALERAQGGAWLPQELQARRANLRKAYATLERQIERLTDAYLAEVLNIDEYRRRRDELEQRQATLAVQEQQLEVQVSQRRDLAGLLHSVEAFCIRVAQGLAEASFEERRQLVELLIDRVVIHPDEIEIRYVVPLSSRSEHIQFCHLRSNYADSVAGLMQCDGQRDPVAASSLQHNQRVGRSDRGGCERSLKGGEALRRLGKGVDALTGWATPSPGCGEGSRRDVDPDEELIGRCGSHRYHTGRQAPARADPSSTDSLCRSS
jgi:site-specific DNA recombinase